MRLGELAVFFEYGVYGNPAFTVRFVHNFSVNIGPGVLFLCLPNSLSFLLYVLMIYLTAYGARVIARINLILTWMVVLVCVRNAYICYGQYARTKGVM
jgi:hypothetical protein